MRKIYEEKRIKSCAVSTFEEMMPISLLLHCVAQLSKR